MTHPSPASTFSFAFPSPYIPEAMWMQMLGKGSEPRSHFIGCGWYAIGMEMLHEDLLISSD